MKTLVLNNKNILRRRSDMWHNFFYFIYILLIDNPLKTIRSWLFKMFSFDLRMVKQVNPPRILHQFSV